MCGMSKKKRNTFWKNIGSLNNSPPKAAKASFGIVENIFNLHIFQNSLSVFPNHDPFLLCRPPKLFCHSIFFMIGSGQVHGIGRHYVLLITYFLFLSFPLRLYERTIIVMILSWRVQFAFPYRVSDYLPFAL